MEMGKGEKPRNGVSKGGKRGREGGKGKFSIINSTSNVYWRGREKTRGMQEGGEKKKKRHRRVYAGRKGTETIRLVEGRGGEKRGGGNVLLL